MGPKTGRLRRRRNPFTGITRLPLRVVGRVKSRLGTLGVWLRGFAAWGRIGRRRSVGGWVGLGLGRGWRVGGRVDDFGDRTGFERLLRSFARRLRGGAGYLGRRGLAGRGRLLRIEAQDARRHGSEQPQASPHVNLFGRGARDATSTDLNPERERRRTSRLYKRTSFEPIAQPTANPRNVRCRPTLAPQRRLRP